MTAFENELFHHQEHLIHAVLRTHDAEVDEIDRTRWTWMLREDGPHLRCIGSAADHGHMLGRHGPTADRYGFVRLIGGDDSVGRAEGAPLEPPQAGVLHLLCDTARATEPGEEQLRVEVVMVEYELHATH